MHIWTVINGLLLALEELRPSIPTPENRKRVVEGDDDDAPPTKMMGQSLSSAEIEDLKLSGAAVKEVVSSFYILISNFSFSLHFRPLCFIYLSCFSSGYEVSQFQSNFRRSHKLRSSQVCFEEVQSPH